MKTNTWETPFLRRRNLLCLLSSVVRLKLLFRISSEMIRTMCLFGRSLSSLQVRLRWQTVPYAAVRSTNTAPAFFLASKESSIFCVSKTVWSTVDLPCRNLACFLGSCGSIIGSTQVWISLFEDLVGETKQRYWAIALRVLFRLVKLWDRDYQHSLPGFGNFESAQAGRKEATQSGF